jgi:hypothetical protein
MGQGAIDVNHQAPAEQLEHEVEAIRGNLTRIAGELDRRRQRLFDWRLQLRTRARPITIAAASVVLLGGGLFVMGLLRRRRAFRAMALVRQWRSALARVARHPELVARPRPSISRNVANAAATSLVGAASRKLAERILSAPNQLGA